MSNASLKKVTGILSAQISGKNSFPEGSAETLYADKLILLFSSYEMAVFGNKAQCALYFLCVREEILSRELVCIKCLS